VDFATELDVAKEKGALGEARAVKYEVVPRTIVLGGASEISEFMRWLDDASPLNERDAAKVGDWRGVWAGRVEVEGDGPGLEWKLDEDAASEEDCVTLEVDEGISYSVEVDGRLVDITVESTGVLKIGELSRAAVEDEDMTKLLKGFEQSLAVTLMYIVTGGAVLGTKDIVGTTWVLVAVSVIVFVGWIVVP
jgi:hypothetical protein